MNFLKHNSSIKIFISHNPNDALHIADKILVMENGTITQFASYNEIYNNPKSYFAFKLFNEINEIKLNKAKIYFRI